MLLSARSTTEKGRQAGQTASDQDSATCLSCSEAYRNIGTAQSERGETSTASQPVQEVGTDAISLLLGNNGIEIMVSPFGGASLLVDVCSGRQFCPLHEFGHCECKKACG